jgi:hypothetical protein
MEDERHATRLYRWRREVLDPIERLPSELATFMIYEVLQADQLYSGRLIELTTVSRSWQGFLFATPALWNELNIDEKQPDLLATLAIFVHLSGKAPLKCVICDYLIQDWSGIMTVLIPVQQRISTLTVRRTSREGSSYSSQYAFSAFFDRLGRPSSVKGVIFDDTLEFDLVQLEGFGLSPAIKFTGTFKIDATHLQQSNGESLVFDMTKYNNLGTKTIAVPASLSLSLEMRRRYQGYRSLVLNDGVTLPYLKEITEKLTTPSDLEHLIRLTASNLLHLHLEVSLSHIVDLCDCLRLLINIQELDLDILISGNAIDQDLASSKAVAPGLRILRLVLVAEGQPRIERISRNILRGLFGAFGSLYPAVKTFSMRTDPKNESEVETWPVFVPSYLGYLRGLESLYLGLDDKDYPSEDPIILWSLLELTVLSLRTFRFLRTPNVLRLELLNPEGWMELSGLSLPHLRTLIVPSPVIDESPVHIVHDLNQLNYHELHQISLSISGHLKSLHNTSLPHLVSITLTSSPWFTNPQGTSLCMSLLYHPDHLPCLQELHFNLCVEWDILFLMLELRNLGTRGVARIHTVGLPFVPFDFRQSLSLLFVGEIRERPSLMDLSLESTRELLFDRTV